MNPPLSVAQCATLACLWEATIPKPGNVHRGADFEDLAFHDFVAAAVAIGPAIEQAATRGVGAAVLAAAQAVRRLAGTNTSLGTILLIAPLAAARRPLGQNSAGDVLDALTPQDSQRVYEAIRVASPGGMGKVESMDVHEGAPLDLLAAMRAAAGRDLVARQYAERFTQLFAHVVKPLRDGLAAGMPLGPAVRHVHVALMRDFPDSLIARKCGLGVATAAAARADAVLSAGQPGDDGYEQAMADLDFWLRSDRRRNPGTTADMIAAGLFVLLRDDPDGTMKFPVRME
jgi:triphosphoribosyl-dephospho-CoA synthase